jgi:hypothetical protein
MPPKPAKKSKAEIEAEKAAAEAAAAEEAKKAAEKRLQEAKAAEKKAAEERVQKEQLRKDDLARLEAERQQDEHNMTAHRRTLEELLQAKRRQEQWQRMIKASGNSGGLSSDDEATLQTFLSQVREHEAIVRQMVLEGRGSMLAPPQMVGSQLPPHLVAQLFGTGGPYSQALMAAAEAAAQEDAAVGGSSFASGGLGSPASLGGVGGLRSPSRRLVSQSLRMASAFFGGIGGGGFSASLPNSVGVGIRVPGVDSGLGATPLKPNSSETITPLTPALMACSELATAAEEVERSLADAIEAGDVQGAARAATFLSQLRALILTRTDAASSQLLESATEYSVELKDGIREVQVYHHVDVLPTPNSEPVLYQQTADPSLAGGAAASRSTSTAIVSTAASDASASVADAPLVRPFVHPRPVADLLFWANLGPGKAVRTKTVRNGQGLDSVRMTPKEADASSTLSVDLHKSVASLNAALRVTRTDFPVAEVAAEFTAYHEARVATTEGLVAEDQWEARGGGGGAATAEGGYLGTSGGPGSNLRTARAARASVSAAGAAGMTGVGRRPGGSAGRSGGGGGRFSSSASRGGGARSAGLERGGAESKEGGDENEEGGDNDDNQADAGDNDGAQGDAEEGGEGGGGAGGEDFENEGSTERGGAGTEKGSVVSERTGGGRGRGGRGAGGGGAGGGDDSIGSTPADQEKLLLSSALRPIGGTALIELLSLQPNATGVKGWLSTRVSPDLSPPLSVHRMAQPSASATSVPSQAIKVKMRIPESVVVPFTMPAPGANGTLGQQGSASSAPAGLTVGRYVRLPPNHPLLLMKKSLSSGPFSTEAGGFSNNASTPGGGRAGTRGGARGGGVAASGNAPSSAPFVPEDTCLPVDLAFAVLHGSNAEVSSAAAVALASSQQASSSSSNAPAPAPAAPAAATDGTAAPPAAGGRPPSGKSGAAGRPGSAAAAAAGNPNAATYAATASLNAEAEAIENSLKPEAVADPTIGVIEAAKAGSFDALSPSQVITAATAPLPTLRVPVPTDPVADSSGEVPYQQRNTKNLPADQQLALLKDPFALSTPKFQSSGPNGLVSPIGFWKVSDEISEVSYDPYSRVLSFTTSSLGAHALLVPRYSDLSYQSWALTPVHGAGSLASRRMALLRFVAAAGKRLKKRFGALLLNAATAGTGVEKSAAEEKAGDEEDADDKKKKKKDKKHKKDKKKSKKDKDGDEEGSAEEGDEGSAAGEGKEGSGDSGSEDEGERKHKKSKDKKEKKNKKDKRHKKHDGEGVPSSSSSATGSATGSHTGSAASGGAGKGGALPAKPEEMTPGFSPMTLIDAIVEAADARGGQQGGAGAGGAADGGAAAIVAAPSSATMSAPGQAPVAVDRDGRTLDHSTEVADLLAPSSASLLPLVDSESASSSSAVYSSSSAAQEARARARNAAKEAAAGAATARSRGRSRGTRGTAGGDRTGRSVSGSASPSPGPRDRAASSAAAAAGGDDEDDDYYRGGDADDDLFMAHYLTADSAEGQQAQARAAPGVILRVKTPRFTVSILFDASGSCRLVGPLDLPELRWLIGSDPLSGEGAVVVPPGQLLYLLYKSGVNLMPTEQDAHSLNFSRKKDMTTAATALASDANNGNSKKSVSMLGGDGGMGMQGIHGGPPPITAVLDGPDGGSGGVGGGGGGARVAFDLPEGQQSGAAGGDGALAVSGAGGEEGDLSSPFPAEGNPEDSLEEKESISSEDAGLLTAPGADDDPNDPYRGQPAFVPLKCKERSLEASVYSDLARICGGFAFSVSRWNATPEVGEQKSVLRAKERPLTPLLPADAPALLHASLSFLECATGLPPLQASEAYLHYLRVVNSLVPPPKPPSAEGDDVPSTPAPGAGGPASRGASKPSSSSSSIMPAGSGVIGIEESSATSASIAFNSSAMEGEGAALPAQKPKKKKVLSEAAAAALLFGVAGLVATLPTVPGGPASASSGTSSSTALAVRGGSGNNDPANAAQQGLLSSPLTSLVIRSLGVDLEIPDSYHGPVAAPTTQAEGGSGTSRPSSAAVPAAPTTDESGAIVSVGSLLPAAVTDTRDPTVWRTLAYTREPELPGCGMSVALVADNESDARKAWKEVQREVREAVFDSALQAAKKSKTGGGSASSSSSSAADAMQDDPFAGAVPASGDAIPGLASSPLASPEKAGAAGSSPQHGPDGQPLPSTNELVPLDGGNATGEGGEGGDNAARPPREPRPRFKGAVEEGSQTHVTARIALETVASQEALKMADAAPPLMQHSVHRLLRMVRPLSFTQ